MAKTACGVTRPAGDGIRPLILTDTDRKLITDRNFDPVPRGRVASPSVLAREKAGLIVLFSELDKLPGRREGGASTQVPDDVPSF